MSVQRPFALEKFG